MGQLLEFASNHPYLVFGVLATWTAVMVYEIRLKSQGASHVSVADAVRLINAGAVVVDVRDRKDFDDGHIVHAKNVELNSLQDKQSSLSKYRKKVLLTVCNNGQTSAKAATLLRKSGFEQVFSIRGGLSGWRGDNMPVEK